MSTIDITTPTIDVRAGRTAPGTAGRGVVRSRRRRLTLTAFLMALLDNASAAPVSGSGPLGPRLVQTTTPGRSTW